MGFVIRLSLTSEYLVKEIANVIVGYPLTLEESVQIGVHTGLDDVPKTWWSKFQ